MANYVYASDTATGVRRAVLENLKLHSGEHNIVIVPDQFSLTIEREILDLLGCDCCFDVEVVSFSRLADKRLGKRGNTLNKHTSVMLLSRVIIQNYDKLVYYKKASRHKGFAEEIYAVITNFRNGGASVETLEKAARNLSGFMRDKLSDVSLLYRGYIEALADYRDMTTMLELLRDNLKTDTDVLSSNYYITDFYEMSHVKYEIVEILANRAKNVYAGILKCSGRNRHIYNTKYADKIISLFGVGEDGVINGDSNLGDEQKLIRDNIFAYGVNCLKFGSERVEVCELRNTEKEIEYTAMRVRRQIIKEGLRYSDIAVVVPDVNAYSDAVKRVFERYEIPYFIDAKYPLAKHTAYRTLKAAFSAASLRQQDVLNLVKEKGFNITDCEQSEFENYLLKNNIDKNSFNNKFNDKTAEKVRFKAIESLKILLGGNLCLNDNVTAAEFIGSVKRFYDYIGAADALKNLDSESGELERSINAQVFDKINDVADEMRALFGDLTAQIEVFGDILFSAMESVKFSTVPLYIDCVFVGDSGDSRFGDMRALYVLGANEGAYPKIFSGNGIVRDADCEILSRYGIELQTSIERGNALKINLLQLLLKPDKLIISAKGAGYDSLLKMQMQSLFMLEPVKVSPDIEYNAENAESIAFAAATKPNLRLAIADGGIKCGLIDNETINIDDEYASKIADIAFYGGRISVSGIEKFYTCPYMFFCEKVLRLKERDIAGEKANDIGTLMHDILERFYKNKYYVSGDIENSVKSIVEECFKDAKYSMLLNSGGKAIRGAMTRRAIKIIECIDNNRKDSEFTPTYFEYDFGEGKTNKGLKLDVNGKVYDIGGYIDRIDVCGDDFAVFDYKSSKKDIDEKAIKRGYLLQLPLYTSIAARNLGKNPVAMLYITMPSKYAKESSANAKCTGFVLNDDAAAVKLDKNDLDGGGFLPPRNKYDKNGAAKGKSCRIAKEDFARYGDLSVKMIKQAAELCDNRDIVPSPIKDACKYCKYTGVCGRADDPSVIREK